jgi:hypothetical protein
VRMMLMGQASPTVHGTKSNTPFTHIISDNQ